MPHDAQVRAREASGYWHGVAYTREAQGPFGIGETPDHVRAFVAKDGAMPEPRTKRPRPPADPTSYPDTSLSPNTYEGRIQAFGNVLRAAKYGDGQRRFAGRVLVGLFLVIAVAVAAMYLFVFL